MNRLGSSQYAGNRYACFSWVRTLDGKNAVRISENDIRRRLSGRGDVRRLISVSTPSIDMELFLVVHLISSEIENADNLKAILRRKVVKLELSTRP